MDSDFSDQSPVSREDTTYIKVLSEAAKAHISKNARKFDDRVDEREPPFMAPSENPDDYSNVSLSYSCLRIALIPSSGARRVVNTHLPWYSVQGVVFPYAHRRPSTLSAVSSGILSSRVATSSTTVHTAWKNPSSGLKYVPNGPSTSSSSILVRSFN